MFSAPTVHSKVELFHQTVNNILDQHCPFKAVKARRDRPPWMRSGLVKFLHDRDKAHRNGSKSWKILRATVQRRVRGAKRSYVRNKLNSQQNTREWWNTLKSITHPNKHSTSSSTPVVNNGQPMTSQAFCDNINLYYANVGGEPVTFTPDVSVK